MNDGILAEDFVEQLCKRTFFADYVFRSPKYTKNGGLQKEASDVLAIFGDTLLAIQVKSRKAELISGELSRSRHSRLTRAIEGAIHQFRALAEALNSSGFEMLPNARGIDVRLERRNLSKVILVVIFVPVVAGAQSNPIRFKFTRSCYPEGDIPVHLFTVEEFQVLLTLLDTMSDLVLHLETRWLLLREKLIPADSDVLDMWAFTTFERKKVREAFETGTPTVVAGMHEKHIESLRDLEISEEASYLLDLLIERLHEAIGAKGCCSEKLREAVVQLAPPGSSDAYHLIIPFLVRLNREERSRLATEWLIRVDRCRQQEISFGAIRFDSYEEAYVIFASSYCLEERQVALLNVGRAVALKMGVQKVICLGAGSPGPLSSAVETMIVDCSKMHVDEDLCLIAGEILGEPMIEEGIRRR